MKQWWKWFTRQPRARQIPLLVLSCHLLLLFTLICHHLGTGGIRRKKAIAVHTVSAPKLARSLEVKPEKSVASLEKKITPSAKKEVKPKKVAPPKKQQAPKPSAVKKSKTTSASPPKPSAPPAPEPPIETAWKELEQELAALTPPSTTELSTPTPLSVPAPLERRAIAEIEESQASDSSYETQLIAFLQSALELPEQGEVKAALTLDASGNLLHCDLLNDKSEKNGAFLKKRLHELCFPCFNQREKESMTFIVVFRNAATS